MQVFVIESAQRGIDEGNHVEVVRSTLEKAESYVRSRGRLIEWRSNDRPGDRPGATAYVWVGSRRRGSEYVFFIRGHELDGGE
ncbi:MAG: hypothetical protein SGJ27_09850 [Candidatus Melainabacteria bacterium]|nr:hypothetical protein [Candidatus Melainabacteria bacterium]